MGAGGGRHRPGRASGRPARALDGHVPSGYLSFALIEPDHRSAKLQFLQPVSGAAAPDQAEHANRIAGRANRRPPSSGIRRSRSGSMSRVPIRASRSSARLMRAGRSRRLLRSTHDAAQQAGVLGFTSFSPLSPAPADVEFASLLGRLVVLAVEGALTRQELQRATTGWRPKRATWKRKSERTGAWTRWLAAAQPSARSSGRSRWFADRFRRPHHGRDRYR